MKIIENYSWGYKNQLYVLKYEFLTSIHEEGEIVSIYKFTRENYRVS